MSKIFADTFRRDIAAENEAEVREALRRRLARRGAAKEMAALLNVSEAYLSMARNGSGPLPPKIAMLLGYRRVVRWERV